MLLQTLFVLPIALVIAGTVYWLLQRRFPGVPGQPFWRRDSRTDLGYFAFVATVGQWLTNLTVIVTVVVIGIVATAQLDGDAVRAFLTRDTALTRQPLWLQGVEVLLLVDFIAYWVHRTFHGWTLLWPFHAVHHSSKQVDWLSSVRVHPVNDAAGSVAAAVVLVAVGFSPGVLAFAVPFFTVYAITLHANVAWTFGPLRYALASPTFHRWHHTTEAQGLDKNFAGLLPLWDIIFGTLYLPRGVQPSQFGVTGVQVPDGFFPQMAYPFRRGRTAAAERWSPDPFE
jgi:sterol desaturase/sphingolipid hydroxylase (fatty acid hydroxylase superfamily)